MVIQVIPPILAFWIRFAIAGAALFVVYFFNERRQHAKNEYIAKNQWKDALATLPASSLASCFITGDTILQGPHQAAQKSTT